MLILEPKSMLQELKPPGKNGSWAREKKIKRRTNLSKLCEMIMTF